MDLPSKHSEQLAFNKKNLKMKNICYLLWISSYMKKIYFNHYKSIMNKLNSLTPSELVTKVF